MTMGTQLTKVRNSRWIGALAGAACLALTATASAADPLVAGSTQIGSHPTYGTSYSGFWRTGFDYSLLTDGTQTYLNAPSSSGAIYFRGANTDWMNISSLGVYLYVPRFTNQSTGFGEYGTATFDAVARIGTHPNYGKKYAAFWLENPNCTNCGGIRDYSLLADSANTFLNASDGHSGTLYFRAGNVDLMTLGPAGGQGLRLQTSLAFKVGGGAWAVLSDRRVKQDITDFHLGLDALEQIRPISFRYNGLASTKDTKTKYVGVVAQELEPILPFMVTTHAEKLHSEDKQLTELKQVDPSAFTYLLINAVKELSAENKQMKRLLCQDHPTESFCTKRDAAPVKGATLP